MYLTMVAYKLIKKIVYKTESDAFKTNVWIVWPAESLELA